MVVFLIQNTFKFDLITRPLIILRVTRILIELCCFQINRLIFMCLDGGAERRGGSLLPLKKDEGGVGGGGEGPKEGKNKSQPFFFSQNASGRGDN